MTRYLRQDWIKWALFILLSIIWGSSFILMKEGLRQLSAFEVASLRVMSAGLVLLPLARNSFQRIPADKLPLVILSGFLGTFFPAYLFCLAETRIDSSLAGMLNALTPISTLSLGALFFQHQISSRKWSGVCIAFVGLVLLMNAKKGGISWGSGSYGLFVLLATLCYGLNVNIVSTRLREIGSRDLAVVAFSVLILPGFLVMMLTGSRWPEAIEREWVRSVTASLVLGMAGTALATILFYVLLRRAGTIFASMVTYGMPFVALGWGLLAGEPVSWTQVACLALILCGVALANR